jgi:hypothetical protein
MKLLCDSNDKKRAGILERNGRLRNGSRKVEGRQVRNFACMEMQATI